MPFDQILPAVAEGTVDGRPDHPRGPALLRRPGPAQGARPRPVVVRADRAFPCRWAATWSARTSARRLVAQIARLLKESILYALEHREEALDYALRYARDLDPALADRFVGMYVNDWTVDYGPRAARRSALLLDRAAEAGLVPGPVDVQFVG